MSEQRRRRPSNMPPYDRNSGGYPQSPADPDDYDAARIARMEARGRAAATQPPNHNGRTKASPVIINQVSVNNSGVSGSSYFDGGLFQWIGWVLLGILITVLTLGICYPFAACLIYSWEAKHTVINGRRLHFDGTGMQLLGSWVVWLLLTIVTFGIYGFWVGIALKKWRTKHTYFV